MTSSWPSNLPVDNQQLIGAALGLIILVVAAVLLRPSEYKEGTGICCPSKDGGCRPRSDRVVVDGGDLTFLLKFAEPKPALNATEWQKYKLIDKVVVSPNTAM